MVMQSHVGKVASVLAIAVVFGAFVVGGGSVLQASSKENSTQIIYPSVQAPQTLAEIRSVENVKNNLYQNMLNSVDFYDTVSGEFTTTFIDQGQEVTVAYQTDLEKQVSYQKISAAQLDLEQYCLDGRLIDYNNRTGQSQTAYMVVQPDAENHIARSNSNICLPQTSSAKSSVSQQRVSAQPDGTKSYSYRTDITNTSFASLSIFPQDLVFGFLTNQDSWDITGVETYAGRRAVVLEGRTADAYYGEKLNVANFVMKVDLSTGILLDFKGYSSDGTLSQSLTTVSIQIDAPELNVELFLKEQAADKQLAFL